MSTQEIQHETPTLADIVAGNIRARAGRLGMSQRDLARALNVTHSTINKRWMGGRTWKLEELDEVAAALRCAPWDLTNPVYESGGKPTLTAVRSLPQLDSNQQPFDYRRILRAVPSIADETANNDADVKAVVIDIAKYQHGKIARELRGAA